MLSITAFPELVVRDAELVDMAVEGVGDAAHVPPDAERIRVEVEGLDIAHLSHASAVEIEALLFAPASLS